MPNKQDSACPKCERLEVVEGVIPPASQLTNIAQLCYKMRMPRITLLPTDEEYERIKVAAGDVPLTRFILRTLLGNLESDMPPSRSRMLAEASKIREQLKEFKQPEGEAHEANPNQDLPRARVLPMDRRRAGANGADSGTPESAVPGSQADMGGQPQSTLPLSGIATESHPPDCRCSVCQFARDAGLKPQLPPAPKKESKTSKGRKNHGRPAR